MDRKITAIGQALLSLLVLVLFFASGFSALLYQVIWQRMLGLFSGVDIFSVTVIVAAFMLGMGCGSMAGGSLADRLSRRALLALFAFAEFMIAIYALASKWLYYDFLYQGHPQLGASPVMLALVLFASLLVPTFFMGITLPLLSRAMTRHLEEAPVRIGALYGINTLGAAIGSVVTALVLVRHAGFEHSLRVGAALNLAVMGGALLVLLLSWRQETSGTALPLQAKLPSPAAVHFPFGAWLLIYALSGFIALGLEVVWFRMLAVMLKSTAFTFGILLGLYLLGLAAGTFLGLVFAARTRYPVQRFLLLQAGITLYAGLSLAWLVHYVDLLPSLALVWNYFAAPINFEFAFDLSKATPEFRMMYFVIAPLMILPPTLLMGASFPFLQKAIQSDMQHLGKRVGWLQTANILGSTLGAIITGLLLLRTLGTSGTLKMLVALGGIHLLLWVWVQPAKAARVVLGALALGLTVAVVMITPPGRLLWAKMHGTTPSWVLYTEDGSGLSFLRTFGTDFDSPAETGNANIFINGAVQSEVPYGSRHTQLGLIPAFLHPAPHEIAIIGLGSGDTLFSAGGRPDTQQLVNIEIIASQLVNIRKFNQYRPYAGLQTLFTDQRFRFLATDARAWLMRSDRKFDIIEADTLRPNMAYAGNLYSEEYFTLLKNHLKPGGYAVSWIPTGRTVQTFRSVFPYTANINNWMFIGSNEPVTIDVAAALERARSPAVQAYYRPAGIDPEAVLHEELDIYKPDPQEQWHGPLNTNTDLFPKDEFETP